MTPDIIERAFQLAPECESIVEVRNELRREGYFHLDAHLEGRVIKSEIRLRLNSPQLVNG